MYCFDTSAFVNPWRRYYPQDLFPSLWEHVEKCIDDGLILAAAEVHHELTQKDDELLAFIEKKEGLFVPLDDAQQHYVTDIVNQFPSWINPESTKNSADPFIVALARQKKLTVVTYETRAGKGSPRVQIPNVCDHYGVPWVDFIQFLKGSGFRR